MLHNFKCECKFLTGKGDMFNAPEYEQVEDELAQKVRTILKEEGLIK